MQLQLPFSREVLTGYDPPTLYKAVMLIVGAGALGQNVLLNLALSGVGELRVVDMDTFEAHNRTRSPVYPSPEEQAHYGLAKAKVVAHKLHPLMTVPAPTMRYANACIQALGEGAFISVDVVVSCVDTPPTRAYLAKQAQLLGLPLVEAGFEGTRLHLSCYPAGDRQTVHEAPCWLCHHPEPDGAFSCRFYAAAAEAVGIIPAIQNGAATLAGLQAEAAIGILHQTMPLAHKIARLDLRTGQSKLAELVPDPLCQASHQLLEMAPEPLTTSPTEPLACLLQELEAYGGPDVQIRLRSPYVQTGPCTRCGGWTAVHQPSWAWEMAPYCQACGGPFVPLGDQVDQHSPEVDACLSHGLTPHLLALPCRQVGFPAQALVRAEWPDQSLRLFRMPGTVDDLFETVAPVQQ